MSDPLPAQPVTIEALVRMVGNVGVPAVLLFYLLSTLTPRLDTIAMNVAASNTQLAIIGASCGGPRPALSNLTPSSHQGVPDSWIGLLVNIR